LDRHFFERDVESGRAGNSDFEVVWEHRDLVDQLVHKDSSLSAFAASIWRRTLDSSSAHRSGLTLSS
jgi:hypothetical protein